MKTQSNRPSVQDVKAAAHDRWHGIHASLGIDPKLLNGKHQPCPSCGGKDRFRYTDFQGNGGFICNHCTPESGSGFDLIMLVFGCTFSESVARVANVLGMNNATHAPLSRTKRQPETTPPPKDQQAALLRLWQQTKPLTANDPASLYLQQRGLSPNVQTLKNIRFAMLEYWAQSIENRPLLLGVLPCMIGAITTPNGELQGVHLTYLQGNHANQWHKLNVLHPQTNEPLPAKKMKSRFSGSLKGAAVHLFAPDPQGRLVVAEGIETALAARELFDLPNVAALSCYGLENFTPPQETKELFIVADNDPNGAGIRAAEKLALRAVKNGLQARIWQPETLGFDGLDELNRIKQNGSRIED